MTINGRSLLERSSPPNVQLPHILYSRRHGLRFNVAIRGLDSLKKRNKIQKNGYQGPGVFAGESADGATSCMGERCAGPDEGVDQFGRD